MSRFERKNLAGMQGYSWGEQPHDTDTIKLNTNENPYPPSPSVQQALAAVDVARLRTYPPPTADALRAALATHHGLTQDNVVMTHGGDEGLRLAITTYVETDGAFGMATPSYSLYPVLAGVHGARVVDVPLQQDWRLPDDTAQRLNRENVTLTCLVNPHAPSGLLTPLADLARLAQELHGVLLIDEAYADFVDPALHYDSAPLLEHHDNVLILRTFSKGYSLAGLRLGYLLGHAELFAPIIGKSRDSYNIDFLSQRLGLASISDQPYASETWSKVRQARHDLRSALADLGLQAPVSEANFLLASVPQDAARSAAQLYAALKERGILVRYFDSDRLRDKLRITIGTPAENQRLLEALTQLL